MRRDRPFRTKAVASVLLGIVLAGAARADLGAVGGRLGDCPSSPNCVSSQASDEDRRIEALAIEGSAAQALERLAEVIRAMPRTRVIVEGNGYLRAEFTTKMFGWVDDVEALAEPGANVIHLRSASRAGYWDLGTNRKRIEEIRERYASKQEKTE